MQDIIDLLTNAWNSFKELLSDFGTFLVNSFLTMIIDTMMWSGELAFNLFSTLINGLTLDSKINAYATQLHPSIGYVFDALNIATYIQIIVAAYITRIVLKMTMPFYK